MRFYYLRRSMKIQMMAESTEATIPLHEPSPEYVKCVQERWENDEDPTFGGLVHEYNGLLMQHGLYDESINPTIPTWE